MAMFCKMACCAGPQDLDGGQGATQISAFVDPDTLKEPNEFSPQPDGADLGAFPKPATFSLKTANKQDGDLKLTFQTFKDKKTLTFKEAPLGLTFTKKLPLEILRVNDSAKKMGVEVGWTILRINDQEIECSGMTYNECFQLLKTQAEKLPLPDKAVKVCFQSPTEDVVAIFTKKPIGLVVQGSGASENPMKVHLVHPGGEAEQKSVKPGWKVLSVDGYDLTNNEDALKVFTKVCSGLPDNMESSPIVGA